MNCINFRQLETDIAKRTQEILNLHHELPKYLTLDEKLKVIVDPEFQEQALTLVKKVNDLKKQNSADTKLMQRAREISIKYDLTIDRSGRVSANPESLDLDKLETEARNTILTLQGQLKFGISNNNLTVETQNTINDEIGKCQKTIENVLLAKKEISC